MKYRFNQKVIVKNGFYKTYKGKIINCTTDKDKNIIYEVKLKIDDEDLIKNIPEKDLKVSWF